MRIFNKTSLAYFVTRSKQIFIEKKKLRVQPTESLVPQQQGQIQFINKAPVRGLLRGQKPRDPVIKTLHNGSVRTTSIHICWTRSRVGASWVIKAKRFNAVLQRASARCLTNQPPRVPGVSTGCNIDYFIWFVRVRVGFSKRERLFDTFVFFHQCLILFCWYVL